MEGRTMRKGLMLKVAAAAMILAGVAAVLFAWSAPSGERVEAASGGPEMGLSVPVGDTTTCPGGTPSGHVCVLAGNSFRLRVVAIGIPAVGYQLAQTYVEYGEDLLFKPDTLENEIVWPDCDQVPVSDLWDENGVGTEDLGEAVAVSHGCLTGIIPPLPKSNHLGDLVELDFNCQAGVSSSTEVGLLPGGDPMAGTNGAKYVDTNAQDVIPKVSNLFVDCIGPTPTPTDTPIPPSPTPTVSPTPSNTPTPLPPPSERPDVKVTKVDLADPVDSGATYTYRITVESIGLQTAEDVVVIDTLPSGSIYKSYTSADATCVEDSGVVTCTVTGDMDPEDVITIDITINAPTPVSDTLVDNLVTVESSNEPFANTGNNKDIEQTIVLAPRSDVTLDKVGDPTFLEGGEQVTYALIATNLGPHTAENVQVVDTLPTNGTFVSATSPECGAPVSGDVTCDLGNIGPSGEVVVEIVMEAPFITRNEFMKNFAVISADNELFIHTGNNLAVENTAVIAPPPDLVVTKTDLQDPILRLGFFSYEITVQNIGDGDALDVVVVDTLPQSTVTTGSTFLRPVTFVSAVGADCDATGVSPVVVTCSVDEILVNNEAVITLNVRGPTLLVDQIVTNNVTVTAADPDEDPVGNNTSETTQVFACFSINGDLVVDLTNDILGVIFAYGLTSEDEGWDPLFDFDGDGMVTLTGDILRVSLNYGVPCPDL